MLWTYVTADIVTVIAQLAGTALTITFGKLVEIGVKVGCELSVASADLCSRQRRRGCGYNWDSF